MSKIGEVPVVINEGKKLRKLPSERKLVLNSGQPIKTHFENMGEIMDEMNKARHPHDVRRILKAVVLDSVRGQVSKGREFNSDLVREVLLNYLDENIPLVVGTPYKEGYGQIVTNPEAVTHWLALLRRYQEAKQKLSITGKSDPFLEGMVGKMITGKRN
jgi:hypothetical protein